MKTYDELLAEHYALASQVEVLNKNLQIAYDCITCADETGYVEDCGFIDLESVASEIAIAISRTPQQHLAEIRAEAGRAGFLEGVRQMCDNEIGMLGHDAESCANHYAAKVRQVGAE